LFVRFYEKMPRFAKKSPHAPRSFTLAKKRGRLEVCNRARSYRHRKKKESEKRARFKLAKNGVHKKKKQHSIVLERLRGRMEGSLAVKGPRHLQAGQKLNGRDIWKKKPSSVKF